MVATTRSRALSIASRKASRNTSRKKMKMRFATPKTQPAHTPTCSNALIAAPLTIPREKFANTIRRIKRIADRNHWKLRNPKKRKMRDQLRSALNEYSLNWEQDTDDEVLKGLRQYYELMIQLMNPEHQLLDTKSLSKLVSKEVTRVCADNVTYTDQQRQIVCQFKQHLAGYNTLYPTTNGAYPRCSGGNVQSQLLSWSVLVITMKFDSTDPVFKLVDKYVE